MKHYIISERNFLSGFFCSLKGIDLGIDVFSGSYPYVISQKAEASVFDYKMSEETEENEIIEPAVKKRKLDECNSGLEELEPSIKKAKIPEACKEVVIDLK